jgi:hypothetical protein
MTRQEAVMLHRLIHEFLAYCRLANFSDRSDFGSPSIQCVSGKPLII